MKTHAPTVESPDIDEFLTREFPDIPATTAELDPETFILDPVVRWAAQQAATAPPIPASAERTVVGLLRQHL